MECDHTNEYVLNFLIQNCISRSLFEKSFMLCVQHIDGTVLLNIVRGGDVLPFWQIKAESSRSVLLLLANK